MESGSSLNAFFVRALSVLMPLAVFYTFYNLSKKVDEKLLFYGIIVVCVVVLITFIQTYQIQLLNSLTGDARAGSLYFYLFLLPLFLMSNKMYIRFGAIVFVASSMIFSLKRGGFVSFGLALIVYYFVSIRISNKKVKVKNLLLLITSLIALYAVIALGFQTYADELMSRLESMGEDEGSNRLEVYKATWNMITNSDAFSLWFGHGWDSVVRNSPVNLSAHNDFLEVIYDFGILALFFYLYLYYRLFKSMFILIRNKSEYAPALAFSLITFTVNSTVAHILIYLYNMVVFALVWGYILGKEKQRLKIAIK
jgi:O-antigen ligase